MPRRSNHELVDIVDDVLTTAIELAYDLDETDADRPTDCPGWTVRDQFAHMVGLEQVLGGAPPPTIELPPLDHVVTDLDAFMERPVHIRRTLPFVAIADEMAGMRPRRIAQLHAAADQGDPEVAGPAGSRPLSAALTVRVFDLWVHEQDIRRAIGLPLRTECAAADVALTRAVEAWRVTLPERVDAGGRLVIQVRGRDMADVVVDLDRGHGDGPAAVLAGDVGELLRAFCGRNAPLSDLLGGDAALIAAVGPQLALTP